MPSASTPDATIVAGKDAIQASNLEHTDKPPIKPTAGNSAPGKEVSSIDADPDEENEPRYRVEKVSNHRSSEPGGVELLVHWGGEYSGDPPTWEPEETIWQDCRNVVLAYWAPNGLSTRTKKLGLDKYKGPFAVSNILKKKMVDDQAYYRVEWVGYAKSTWEPIGGLPSEIVTA